VIKRGQTWSYVIRVNDPDSGLSRPKWVGGFPTEREAKAARDDARVTARRGEYVHRSRTTLEDYLLAWLTDHAASVKRTTINGYREDLERYVIPHIGRMPVQRIKPATITSLYRDLTGDRRASWTSPVGGERASRPSCTSEGAQRCGRRRPADTEQPVHPGEAPPGWCQLDRAALDT
jgi:integrase